MDELHSSRRRWVAPSVRRSASPNALAGVVDGGGRTHTIAVCPGQTVYVTAPTHQRRGEVCLPRALFVINSSTDARQYLGQPPRSCLRVSGGPRRTVSEPACFSTNRGPRPAASSGRWFPEDQGNSPSKKDELRVDEELLLQLCATECEGTSGTGWRARGFDASRAFVGGLEAGRIDPTAGAGIAARRAPYDALVRLGATQAL
jgi:hypothetical protein